MKERKREKEGVKEETDHQNVSLTNKRYLEIDIFQKFRTLFPPKEVSLKHKKRQLVDPTNGCTPLKFDFRTELQESRGSNTLKSDV